MTKLQIKNILDNHGQAYKEREDKVYALDVAYMQNGEVFQEWVNVTDWSTWQLLAWLGY